MSSPIPRRLFLYAQHLGNESYAFNEYAPPGTGYGYVLLPRSVPSDLVNANDFETQAVTQLVETLQIDRRFVLAQDIGRLFFMKGTAMVVCTVGAKGDAAAATNISRVTFDLERVDDQNIYDTILTRTITLTPVHSVVPVTYELVSVEALMRLDDSLRAQIEDDKDFARGERLSLRIRVYAYMAAGGTAQAVRLYYTRGSSDTFLELPMVYPGG